MKKFVKIIVLIAGILPLKTAHASRFEVRLVLPEASENSESLVFENSRFKETLHVDKEALVTEKHVKDVSVKKSLNDEYQVQVQLTEKGAKAFTDATSVAKGGRLAILIDGEVYTAPRVHQEFTIDVFSIAGGYDLEEARRIADVLSLPNFTDGRTTCGM